MTQTFKPDATLIDRDLARHAHYNTSHTPEERGEQEIACFMGDVADIYDDLITFAQDQPERDIINSEIVELQKRYAQKYSDKLSAQSRCASSFIVGPANFPANRAENAMRVAIKRGDEMREFADRATNAIKKRIKAQRTADAGGEAEIMKMKLANAERHQAMMKACNKIIRSKKLSDNEKIVKMVKDVGISEDAAIDNMTPDCMGEIGFPHYRLSNNNANIKRMKTRVVDMQTKEDTPTSEIEFNGGSIIDNTEDDRVQIDFDSKPGDAMRTKLKGSGWRWAPSVGMWQRKRTPAAMTSAKQITKLGGDINVSISIS